MYLICLKKNLFVVPFSVVECLRNMFTCVIAALDIQVLIRPSFILYNRPACISSRLQHMIVLLFILETSSSMVRYLCFIMLPTPFMACFHPWCSLFFCKPDSHLMERNGVCFHMWVKVHSSRLALMPHDLTQIPSVSFCFCVTGSLVDEVVWQ